MPRLHERIQQQQQAAKPVHILGIADPTSIPQVGRLVVVVVVVVCVCGGGEDPGNLETVLLGSSCAGPPACRLSPFTPPSLPAAVVGHVRM